MLFRSNPKILRVEFSNLERKRNIINLVNISSTSETLRIQFDKDPNWDVGYEKKSKIAVGLHQEIIVDFFPKEFREYQHMVTVRTREGNFDIPFLAIPVDHSTEKEEKVIPRFIPPYVDFGKTKLRQTKTRKFWLYFDNVVSEYDFHILIIKQSSQTFFQINPLKGKLIPGKKVEIEIKYQPLDYVTSTVDFKLDTTKPFFESQFVRIIGHCVLPSFKKHREKILRFEDEKKQVVVDHKKRVKFYYGISPFTASLLRKKERESKQSEREKQMKRKMLLMKMKKESQRKSSEIQLQKDIKKYSMKSKHLRLERKYRAFLHREKSKEIKWFSEVGQELVTFEEQDEIRQKRAYELRFHGIYRRGKDRERENNIISFNPVVNYDFKSSVVGGEVTDWREPETAKQEEESGKWVDIRRFASTPSESGESTATATTEKEGGLLGKDQNKKRGSGAKKSSASSSRRSSTKPTPRKRKATGKKSRRRGSRKPGDEEQEEQEVVLEITEEQKLELIRKKKEEEEKIVFGEEAKKMKRRLMRDFRQLSEYVMLQTRVEDRLKRLESSSLEQSSVVRLRKSGIPPLQYRKIRVKEIAFRNPGGGPATSGGTGPGLPLDEGTGPEVPEFRDFELMKLKAPCYYRVRNYQPVKSFPAVMTYMPPQENVVTFSQVEETKMKIDEERIKEQEEKDRVEREKQERLAAKKSGRRKKSVSGRGKKTTKKKK